MIVVTAEASAWLYTAISEERKRWKFSEFQVGRDRINYFATRFPDTPVDPTKATDPVQSVERETFDNPDSRTFYVNCVAIQKALQELFNHPNVGEMLPMEEPK